MTKKRTGNKPLGTMTAAEFSCEAHRQSALVAAGEHEAGEGFVDAVSADWDGAT